MQTGWCRENKQKRVKVSLWQWTCHRKCPCTPGIMSFRLLTIELEGVVRPKIDTDGLVQGEQADEGEVKITMMDLNVTENVHAHVLCHEGFLGITCSLLNIPGSILVLHVSFKEFMMEKLPCTVNQLIGSFGINYRRSVLRKNKRIKSLFDIL